MYRTMYVNRSTAFFVAILLGFGSLASAAAPDLKTVPSKPVESALNTSEVVARVNGTNIKGIDLQRAKKVIMAGQPNQQVPPEKQKEFDLQALTQLVSAELLYQVGLKLTVTELDKK